MFKASSSTADAPLEVVRDAGKAPDREVHAAALSCPGGTLTWTQPQSAWNSNTNTAGTYSCTANVTATSDGTLVVMGPSSPARSGTVAIYCNNGTWQDAGGASCNGSIFSISAVCSSSEPVRSMWIGWYLADLKRCADSAGLEWWVTQYNNNAACPASTNYDGYGSKDACWRAQFRTGANNNGNTYNQAQATGHIASSDELSMCGSSAAYPWANVSANGTQCKYRP
ncbi:hypothetical protein [Cystobacter fuscus]|uniref:hypothetical protein n=1 Tax=Cystobacter fuscus TaxID=43 RepID=UPI002B2C1487|nr:hypothetical protein F0U63_33570 [Cystobacter fuscus]